MIDEELLKPSREHLDRLKAAIRKSEIDTIEKIDQFKDDDAYAQELWRRHYVSIAPIRREIEAVVKVITDYYARQAAPTMLIDNQQQERKE